MADAKPIENEPIVTEQPQPTKLDKPTQSYFFPNAGQPFSCEAASREEAEAMNDAYLQTLEKGAVL